MNRVLIRSMLMVGMLALPWLASPAFGGGNVVAWGSTSFGLSTPCVSNVVAIATGYEHSLLLKEDGTVADCGMFLDPSGGGDTWDYPITVPAGLNNVVAVAGGSAHSLALKSDGTVVAWGRSTYGQTDVPPGLANVVAISASASHSLALKADGTVIGWGGLPASIPTGLNNVIAIAAGSGDLALKADGTVVGWGFPYAYLTNNLTGLSNVVAISSGYNGWLALKADGTVQGNEALSNVVAIAQSSGTDHHINLAIKSDGTVVGWGYNFYGGPMVPAGLSNVVAVSSDSSHCLALVGGGQPFISEPPVGRTVGMAGTTRFRVAATGAWPLDYQWRHFGTNLPGATRAVLTLTNVQPSQAGGYSIRIGNSLGQATSRDAVLTVVPLSITAQPTDQQTFRNGPASIQIAVQGETPLWYQWLKNGVILDGATCNPLVFSNAQPSDIADYSVVVSNSFGTVTSGQASLTVLPVAAWGSFLSPPSVELTNAIALAAGWVHGVALKSDGTVKVWGGNPPGSAMTPDGLSNVVAVAAGGSQILALKEDGALAHWWDYRDGPSTTTPSTTNIVAIAAGMLHSIALKADGTVMAWGDDDGGATNVPPGLSNVVRIAAGNYSGLALKEDGTVVCWGGYGAFLPPADLGNFEMVNSGGGHGLGLKPDGTVVAWGSNIGGQTNVPPGLTNAVSVAGGGNHSLALKSDGCVIAWGADASGQCNVPRGLTNVTAIVGGGDSSLALIGDGPPVLHVPMSNPTTSSNGFSVSIPTQSGRVYRLEYKESLSDTNWKALPLVAGNGHLRVLTGAPVSGGPRFYRVRQW